MKIAVLTMTFNNNYGGMLQAYSLMETLKKLHHDPELLFVQLENKDINACLKKLLKKYIFSYISKKWKHIRFQNDIEKNTNYFIEKYINPKTKSIYTRKDFRRIVLDKYDAYVVGSDQVWRPSMYKFINYAFFSFVKNPNAILFSYAPSFGVEYWEYTDKQTIKYKEQLRRFKAVSVREDSGVELCKKYFGTDAIQVLDPTMLLTLEDYRKIIKQENEPKHNGELLSYILDYSEDKQDLEDMISKELNLKSFTVGVKSNNIDIEIKDMIYPTVTSWLRGFEDAKYVITDSFHGCVFSIIFNKPFIVYGNEKRGISRFNSLLKMFRLEDRLIMNKKEITIDNIRKDINWIFVNNRKEELIKESKNYLSKSLKN